MESCAKKHNRNK